MRYADRVKKDPSRSLVYAMAEESLAFYALVITVLIAAGFDALTGAAVVLLGCGIGLIGSTVTTFATGIAWGIAGVPISEGLRARARDRARQRPPGRPARADGLGLQGGRGVPPRRPRRADRGDDRLHHRAGARETCHRRRRGVRRLGHPEPAADPARRPGDTPRPGICRRIHGTEGARRLRVRREDGQAGRDRLDDGHPRSSRRTAGTMVTLDANGLQGRECS